MREIWNDKWQVIKNLLPSWKFFMQHVKIVLCFMHHLKQPSGIHFILSFSLKGRYLYIINEHGEAIGRKLAQGVPMRKLTFDLLHNDNFKIGKNYLKYYSYTTLTQYFNDVVNNRLLSIWNIMNLFTGYLIGIRNANIH